MTGLLDITHRTLSHTINGTPIVCEGITADGLARLMDRFPALRETLFPMGVQPAAAAVSDAPSLMKAAPEAIAAIITAGTQNGPDADPAELEKAARKLSVNDQIDLLTKILILTIGEEGFVPFVEKITALFGAGSPQAPPNDGGSPNGTSSPNGRAPDTPLPLQSTG